MFAIPLISQKNLRKRNMERSYFRKAQGDSFTGMAIKSPVILEFSHLFVYNNTIKRKERPRIMEISDIINQTKRMIENKEYNKALKFTQSIEDIAGDQKAQILFLTAIIYFKKENYSKSAHYFEQIFDYVLENFSSHWDGHELMYSLFLKRKYDLCYKYIDKYLSANQHDGGAYKAKGIMHYKMGNCEKALETFLLAVSLLPNDSQLMLNIAEMHKELENRKEAMSFYEKAYECSNLTPDSKAKIINSIFDAIIFERQGDCNSCNGQDTCCQNVTLSYFSKQINSQSLLNQLLIIDPRCKNWVHTATNEFGNWLFNCKHLTTDRKCAIHKKRPQLCRDFPNHFWDTKSYVNCSYQFVLQNDIPAFTSAALLKEILRVLEEENKHAEIKILKEQNQGLSGIIGI